MINVNPSTLQGKKRYGFITEWGEVDVVVFSKWQRIALKLKSLEEKLRLKNIFIAQKSKEYEKIYFDVKNAKNEGIIKRKQHSLNRVKKLIERKQKEAIAIIDEKHLVEVQGIILFTDIPVNLLLSMERRSYFLPEGKEDIESNYRRFIIDDNHIASYKQRLSILASCPLPDEASNYFVFQGATDDEIKNLEQEYENLGLRKIFKQGKDLKKKIEGLKKTKYTITNIWEQSTYLNKEYQELANEIQSELQKGVFDNLAMLIAMLSVVGSEDSEELDEVVKGKNVKAYVEKYNEVFKKIYDRRVEIFTKQKVKLPITVAIQVRNFFLSN